MVTTLQKFRKGDSFNLEFDLQDFPATEGWQLSYKLRGPAAINIAATIDDGQYLVNASPATTGAWIDGNYWAFAVVSLAGEIVTVELGETKILPSLTDLTTLDQRSHVKKVLDALEALLEGKALEDVAEFTIGNRSLTAMKPDELLKWKDHYSKLYRREKATAEGKKPKNRVLVRF